MIEIRPLNESEIPDAHRLSVEIFDGEGENGKYGIQQWRDKLAQHGLIFGALDGERLVGFKFGYARDPGTFHSWLGGVCNEYRRRGIMRQLTTTQEAWAANHGFSRLTVNTYQHKFPAMYQFLEKSGYKIDKTHEEIDGKTHFYKDLKMAND